jgi:DNA-binding transcriptional MerR regulator
MDNNITLNSIAEMLGGYDNGFDNETIYYVYYSLIKDEEKARFYKSILENKNKEINEKVKQLKNQEVYDSLLSKLREDVDEIKNDLTIIKNKKD